MLSGELLLWVIIPIVAVGGLYLYNQVKFIRASRDYPPQGHFVSVNGFKLHYISEGTGQPVVFLHGGVLSSDDFSEVIKLAAKDGYQAIAFDRPGYGYSGRPLRGMTPVTQAALIHKAVKALHIDEPIILVGHSWSGTMTLSYAMQFPNDVAGLVTLGGAMYKEGYPGEHGDSLSSLVTIPIIGDLIMNTLLATPLGTLMGKSATVAMFKPENPPSGYEEKLLALWARPKQFKANREDTLAFPKTSAEISQWYKDIQTPVVIVVGEEDPFNTIQMAERLHHDLPHSKLVKLARTGHMIPDNHPLEVIKAIELLKRFMDSSNE
jgi:pimeloyl-ACP methyl ester carboxylesterase